MAHLLPINLLRTGRVARIDEIAGQPGEVQRLEELGLRRGSEIEVLQQGCPCIVRCRGAKYCLRGNECTCVLVRVDDES